ncbi:hypothetical protein PIB30_067071 [Stylosanthes scabra]|uniref:Uncharacterized protein n=1 Tax=Stylosanthes scabra TaxID=79078 RepID=A0ABU6ZL58_9FABA|nr:hypothetical protein [Stylosanthes scabra]
MGIPGSIPASKVARMNRMMIRRNRMHIDGSSADRLSNPAISNPSLLPRKRPSSDIMDNSNINVSHVSPEANLCPTISVSSSQDVMHSSQNPRCDALRDITNYYQDRYLHQGQFRPKSTIEQRWESASSSRSYYVPFDTTMEGNQVDYSSEPLNESVYFDDTQIQADYVQAIHSDDAAGESQKEFSSLNGSRSHEYLQQEEGQTVVKTDRDKREASRKDPPGKIAAGGNNAPIDPTTTP